MRFAAAPLALALASALAGQTPRPASVAQPAAQVKPVAAEAAQFDRSIAQLEGEFEKRLNGLDPQNPFVLMGACSGVYLNGVGVVFVAPLDLINTPRVWPFRPVITKEQAAQVHTRKLAHLAPLRQAMREMVAAAARSPLQLAPDEKITLAIRLFYLEWEDRTGLPSEIVMTADRASAVAGNFQTDER